MSQDKKNPGVPTPRTDAEASAADDFVVSAEFARQLERELTEAKVLLHNQAQAVIAMNTGIGSAIRTSPTNGLWVVWYEDTEKKPDVFFGDGAEAAARAKFASANDNWSCHLLTRICSPVYGSCGLVAGHAGQHNAKPASFKQEMSDERTRQPSVGSAQPSAPLELQVSVRREPSVPLAAVVQDEQIRPLVPDLPEVKHSVERIGPEMENNCDWEAAFDAEMALSEAISERNKRNFYAALERFPKLASSVERMSFQHRVGDFLLACFGEAIAADKTERNHRFLEESLELVQSLGCTAAEAHMLVDYTFGRPAGVAHQETGGVMVTLAALCRANGIDMDAAGDDELRRVWGKIDVIREKQKNKPRGSPLPEYADRPIPASAIKEIGE
jgi:hypothetical protein